MRIRKSGARWALAGIALTAVAAGALLIATAAMAANQQVTVQGFAFGPASITVNTGDSVTWTNKDSTAHTVTADGGSFDQPLPASGGTATITFNTAGTFPYHCTIHPNMHGTVVVLAAAATTATATASPAAGSSPAAGGGSAPTVTAPATGTGTPTPVESWGPLLALAGGLLVAIGLGGGILALAARRDD